MSAQGQGCSDAGFCTAPGLRPDSLFTTEDGATQQGSHHSLRLGLVGGATNYRVAIAAPYAEYELSPGQRWIIAARFSASVRHGAMATTAALADAMILALWQPHRNWQLTAGAKLPLHHADARANDLPLPMAYQPSLGTTDAIAGLQWRSGRFLWAAGWQQPFTQNRNAFSPALYDSLKLDGPYLRTTGFGRAGDMLLRGSYFFRSKPTSRWHFTAGAMGIYHLANDSYLNDAGQRISIAQSRGLTANLYAFAQYRTGPNRLIELFTGFPIVARSIRPEGLSQLAVGIEYRVQW